MSLRFRHLRKSSLLCARILSENVYCKFRRDVAVSASTSVRLAGAGTIIGSKSLLGEFISRRFSTIPQVSQASSPHIDLLSYVKSAVDELRGPSHYWLNRGEKNRDYFKREGTYLVLAGRLLDRGSDPNDNIFEKVKLLQQRFPQVCFMGIYSSNQARIANDRTELTELIVKEYLSFPVLLTEKEFPETALEVCYTLFRDFKDPLVYNGKSVDIAILSKALQECVSHENEKPKSANIFTNTWSKQADSIKELHVCSVLQDLLLYFPGCVSADKTSGRLFLSDSNHHRVIIFDSSGKILDSIGCCPGFEDGEFESAKLLRPAASFYDEDEDYLYIIDSENHAIRRADMERRVLETVYPNHCGEKNIGLWSWIMNKLGLGKDNETTPNDAHSDELDSWALIFPWHILKSDDDSFYVINKSFQKLWIIDLSAGEIKEIVEGIPKVLEACQELMTDKLSALSHFPCDQLQQQTEAISLAKKLPQAALISSVTNLQEDLFMADMVGHRVLKLNRESGACSNIQLSNLGILGLPYWLSIPLERVVTAANGVQEVCHVHSRHFRLLPGKVNIRLNIELPTCTELVEPLQESCIWRQARGAATELSGAEDAKQSSEKVGVSQQWYDELDSLAFETPDPKTNTEDGEEEEEGVNDKTSDIECEDKRVHINCTVHTSPGTSEVIIYAALYLRLARNANSEGENQEELASRIVNILNAEMRQDLSIKLLLKSNRDLRDLIFMKPMNVRIKLDSMDHPKADNSKDIILTDSSFEVDVSL